MAEYLVDVERYFHGPLDLLLHLVREKEIEVDKISLAKVADDYARYVESLRDLDVNAVGEYLVIAATLMLIKSRYLMPREIVDVEEDLGPDDELILQLIEYKRFRETAGELRGYLTVVPEARWIKHADNQNYFLSETLEHYEEHLPQLRAILAAADR